MRRFTAAALVFAMILVAAPLFAARAPRAGQAQGAALVGSATSSTGQTLVNVTVQLRDLVTGTLAGTTTSSATGSFAFAGLQAGSYAVEVVSAAGTIVGTSASVAVSTAAAAAGATISGITVTASAALAGAAAGAAGAAAGAAGGGAAGAAGAAAAGAAGAAAGVTTAAIVTTVAAVAGVAGAVATGTQNASPSR